MSFLQLWWLIHCQLYIYSQKKKKKKIVCLAGKVLYGCIGNLGSNPSFAKDGGLRSCSYYFLCLIYWLRCFHYFSDVQICTYKKKKIMSIDMFSIDTLISQNQMIYVFHLGPYLYLLFFVCFFNSWIFHFCGSEGHLRWMFR